MPWEGDSLGYLVLPWFRTCVLLWTRSRTSFRNLSGSCGLLRPALFVVFIGLFAALVANLLFIWSACEYADGSLERMVPFLRLASVRLMRSLLWASVAPLCVAALCHLSGKMFCVPMGSFRMSFRATAYAMGAVVPLVLIPFIGTWVATFSFAGLLVVGFSECHRCGIRSAAFSTSILLCGGSLVTAILRILAAVLM